MLYSLIPPILIILSLIGIILMLVKKAKQTANLPDDHFQEIAEEVPAQAGFFGRISWKIKSIRWDDVKHFLLAILEKLVRRFRVVFLKLESRFGDLSNDIRSKRQARALRISQSHEARRENSVIRRLENYQPEKKETVAEEIQIVESAEGEIVINRGGSKRRLFAKKTKVIESIPADEVRQKAPRGFDDEEREVKPIISERIVTPRPRTEIKDRLEELLIERIAVNPKDIEAYERLGEYYMEIKSYADAKECFKQVIKLSPANRNAKYRMRRLETILAKQ